MDKCEKIEKMIIEGTILSDINNELDEQVSEHIESCDSCNDLTSDLLAIELALKELPKIKVSDTFNDKLQAKLSQHKNSVLTSPNTAKVVKTVPLYARIFSYAAGIAVVALSLVYLNNSGALNNINGNTPNFSHQAIATVSSDTIDSQTIADSLKSLKENVIENEDLIHRVSAGE